MYSGEQAAAAPVPQMAMPRDVMSGVVAKGMQQVGANLDGMLMRGIQMEDAKNEFEAERELMSINSDTQAEVERMLNTPDGKDGSLFDEHGQIRQEKVMNVRDKVQARLAKVGQNIIDPERKERLVRRAMLEGDKILDDLGQTWEKVTRRKTETAWKDALELAEAKGEFAQFSAMADRGVELGIISKDKASTLKLEFNQKNSEKAQEKEYADAMNLAVSDPQGMLLALARGEYADMDGVRKEKVYNMARQVAASHAQQEDFSADDMKKLQEGQVVKPKFKVRNGATEKEWKWREYYNREGTYDKFAGEIRSDFDEEVMNCPVPESKEDAELWVSYMVKKWCDPQTGYGLEEYSVKLRCQQAMDRWLGAVKDEGALRFSTDAFLNSLTDAQIAPWAEGQVRYVQSEYADDKMRQEEAAGVLSDRKALILHDVRNAMARWEAGNPEASYSKAYEHCLKLLIDTAKEKDTEIDYESAWFNDNDVEFEESAREGSRLQRYNIERDANTGPFRKEAEPSGKAAQQKAHQEYKATQKTAIIPEQSKAERERVYSIGMKESDDEVLFVTQAEYDALSKKFGENPVAHVTLPGSKAYMPVPVKVGNVDGFSLSDAAMVRLNNTKAKKAMIRFSKGEAKQKEKKEENKSEPPSGKPDDGLVPENEVAYEEGEYVPEDRNFLFPDENGN